MFARLKQLITDESGISAIEYALIAGLIALGIVGGAKLLGNAVNEKFNSLANELENNTTTTTDPGSAG